MADSPRIAVLIPSRGRPLRLERAIASIQGKVSGEHGVRYVIGCDADDQDTIAMALTLYQSGLPVIPHIAPRQPSLGGLVNLLALRCPSDVYVMLGDDVEIQTAGWDRAVADAWQAQPDTIWFWRTETNATFGIISEKWRAASGRLLTEHFPFWYDDMWLIEVWRYATGTAVGANTIEAHLADRGAGTLRMRDLREWDDFFWSSRSRDERKAEARKIAAALGWPRVESFEGLDVGRSTNFDADGLEQRQGDREPPDPGYLIALNRMRGLRDQQKEAA